MEEEEEEEEEEENVVGRKPSGSDVHRRREREGSVRGVTGCLTLAGINMRVERDRE